MELKTLKEINFTDYTTSRNRIKHKLRQEAIKWIRTDDLKLFDFLDVEDGCYHDIYMLKIGLKKMFNITEEDLKDEMANKLEKTQDKETKIKKKGAR